ncbi:MAG TPA: type IV secretion system DNA-binding domain-containing protein [Candidatus Angelobacter sp.]|nr:type IV secretion system DNA-binding domain-containing protein [Candidatus Angelobacter sp.]
MNSAFFTSRANANKTIAAAVAAHLFFVVLASRFQTVFFSAAAFYSGLALYCFAGPALWLWHRTTLPLNKRGSLDDIRDTTAEAKALEKYSPEAFFAPEKGLFVGLDIGDGLKPLYTPWGDFRKGHMQVVGTTGFGKGVATTMMLAQCAMAGECVVVFDPKYPGDEFAPRVFNKLSKERGIPLYYINLSPAMPPPFNKQYPETPPQLNIFGGCTKTELEELLMTAFDLADGGSNADFYRLFDRLACQDVCARATADGHNATIKDLVTAANKSRAIDDEKGQKFKANLIEISQLPVLNTDQGHDLRSILEQNAILYIVGSTRNTQVTRVQKMLLLRILQLIEQRDRLQKLRPVAMMLDELKYLLSPGVLQALGTVRDKGCHVMLAHQTNGDLRDCGGLDPETVTSAIKVNTAFKLIYRCVDNDDAEWASLLSGTIVVQQKSAHMQQGMFHAGEGQYRDMERPFLTENQLRAMPKMTGMLFGFGLSKRVQVAPMSIAAPPEITPAPPIAKQSKQQKGNKPAKDKPAANTIPAASAPVMVPEAEPQTNAPQASPEHQQTTEESAEAAAIEIPTDLDNLI